MTEELPIFLIMVGIPGSGKSSWIAKNIDPDQFVIISPDLIRKEITGEISDVSQDRKVWPKAKEDVIEALKQGKNVVLDATNVNGERRREFIKDLPPCKLQAKIFYIDPEEAKKRISEDVENGVDRSHVPIEVVDTMYLQFIGQSQPEQLREEGFELLE